MTYFIPAVLLFARNRQTGGTDHLGLPHGELAIWNPNGMCYQFFKNVLQVIDRDGWTGEAEALDPHFSKVIFPNG